MVDSHSQLQDPSLVSLPLSQYGHKVFSSLKNKNGKNEDEKSFNRYVRTLVDQYLDKEVVISKQPEDKVELIVQSCREKFPEFAHWTTTRIRIYIESCRRLKKIKNSPLLLAKRKAAGRRFREGQKLKRILSSQFSMHAAESNRQLAEYILRANDSLHEEAMCGIEDSMSEPDIKVEAEEKEHSAFKNVYTGLQADTNKVNTETFNGVSMKPIQFINNPALANIMQLAPQLLRLDQPLLDQQSVPVMTEAVTPAMTSQSSLMTSSRLIKTKPFLSTPSILSSNKPFLSTPSMLSRNSILSRSPSMLPSRSPTLLTSSPVMLTASSPTTLSAPSITRPQPVFSTRVISPVTPANSSYSPSNSINGRPVTPPSERQLKIGEFTSPLNISIETPPSSTTSHNSPPPTSSPKHYISPKQKSFQIDSLINSTRCPDNARCTNEQININTRPTISFNKLDKPQYPASDKPLYPTGGMTFSEIINAKTLVTSYREAANFLYRAATELEQLLPSNTVF